MTFRRRLTIASSAAVAVAIALSSVVIFFVVRGQLRAELDGALRELATDLTLRQSRTGPLLPLPRPPLGAARGYAQAVTADGLVIPPPGFDAVLPAGERARAVAAGRMEGFFDDLVVQGFHVRVLTTGIAPGVAVQVVRSLEEVDSVLRRLALILLAVAGGGIGLAALLGGLVARATLRPVRELTEATEHVTATSDLSERIEAKGKDELARLAASFNSMLEALQSSVDNQRQLVADASHELRTPLTSVRTNLEVLQRDPDLGEEERRELVADVLAQLEELTTLVADIVELARGSELIERTETVDLGALVGHTVERARRRHGTKVSFSARLEPFLVEGVAARLDRAVANLLDNAAEWSPPAGTVDVELARGKLTVADRGPGIADEDKHLVFERFYRARSARGRPGSGLGLAIVRQVAESHGGSVTVEDTPGGGARLVMRVPTSETESEAGGGTARDA